MNIFASLFAQLELDSGKGHELNTLLEQAGMNSQDFQSDFNALLANLENGASELSALTMASNSTSSGSGNGLDEQQLLTVLADVRDSISQLHQASLQDGEADSRLAALKEAVMLLTDVTMQHGPGAQGWVDGHLVQDESGKELPPVLPEHDEASLDELSSIKLGQDAVIVGEDALTSTLTVQRSRVGSHNTLSGHANAAEKLNSFVLNKTESLEAIKPAVQPDMLVEHGELSKEKLFDLGREMVMKHTTLSERKDSAFDLSLSASLKPETAAGSGEKTDAVLTTASAQSGLSTEARDSSMQARLKTSMPQATSVWADELGDKIKILINGKVQEAKIAVDPPELGPINIKIVVNQQQDTQIQIHAQHAHTREALEYALPRLKEMLAMQGLHLSDSSVSDNPGNQQFKQSTPSYDGMEGAETNEDDSAGPARAVSHDGVLKQGVDFYA